MMKTNRTLMVALAVATIAFAGPALAQYTPTGDDGITASPRLRERLDERHRNEAITVAPEMRKMACPNCAEKVTMRVDYTARGAYKPTVPVVLHECSGCDTTITTSGVGKGATTAAVHTCAGCGAENLACCNAAKGSSVTTKGMEKEKSTFEVAPVK